MLKQPKVQLPSPTELESSETFLTEGASVAFMAQSRPRAELSTNPRYCPNTEPCKKLLSALLERCILDMRSPDVTIVASARKWLWCRKIDIEDVMSLAWVLDQLGWPLSAIPAVRQYALTIGEQKVGITIWKKKEPTVGEHLSYLQSQMEDANQGIKNAHQKIEDLEDLCSSLE